MATQRIDSSVAQVSRLVAELHRAKSDTAREKCVSTLVELFPSISMKVLEKAFDSLPTARPDFPYVLARLIEAGLGVKEAKEVLRSLLGDKTDSISGGAAQQVARFGWGDEFVRELSELTMHQDNPSGLLAGISALDSGTSRDALDALMALWARGVKNEFRRGNVLRAIAKYADPKTKSIFQSVKVASGQHPYVTLMARFGLACLGDIEEVLSLRPALDSEDSNLRNGLARALYRLFGKDEDYSRLGIKKLAKYWDSHPEEVRKIFLASSRVARTRK